MPLRKRMVRREHDRLVRFVTFSCNRREPLLGNDAARGVFARALTLPAFRARVELYAWVVMPEHAHLLLRPREGVTLDGPLRALKMSVAKRMLAKRDEGTQEHRSRRGTPTSVARIEEGNEEPPRRFWQRGGGFDRNVRDMEELTREIRYIHRNPAERRLVAHPLEWAWSSARWWNGERGPSVVPCEYPPSNGGDWSRWKGWM